MRKIYKNNGNYTNKDLKNFSKTYLWQQLDAVEDERNKLLNLCNAMSDYFYSLPMLTEEQESLLTQLEFVTGR